MRTIIGILLAIIFSIATITPAFADKGVNVEVAYESSPITINVCYAGLKDSNVGNINYYLQNAIAFTNTSSQTATAVQFKFEIRDAFNTVVGTTYAQETGTYSPGVLIDISRNYISGAAQAQWSTINIWPSLDTVVCSVDKVRFTDGTVWDHNSYQNQVHELVQQQILNKYEMLPEVRNAEASPSPSPSPTP